MERLGTDGNVFSIFSLRFLRHKDSAESTFLLDYLGTAFFLSSSLEIIFTFRVLFQSYWREQGF